MHAKNKFFKNEKPILIKKAGQLIRFFPIQ